MIAGKLRFSEMPADYAGLIAMYPPRPLHDAVDERNVEEIVEAMAGFDLSADQDDYVELLSDLLLKFQDAHDPGKPRRGSAHSRFKYLVQQSGLTPPQLAKVLGCSQSLVSLLLNGKRSLSKQNIKKLAIHFKVDAGYFL